MTGTWDSYRGMYCVEAVTTHATAVAHGSTAAEAPGAGAGKVVVLGNE